MILRIVVNYSSMHTVLWFFKLLLMPHIQIKWQRDSEVSEATCTWRLMSRQTLFISCRGCEVIDRKRRIITKDVSCRWQILSPTMFTLCHTSFVQSKSLKSPLGQLEDLEYKCDEERTEANGGFVLTVWTSCCCGRCFVGWHKPLLWTKNW